MVGRLQANLILFEGAEELLEEIAAEYDRVRLEGGLPMIKGRKRIHKAGKRSKAVPANELEGFLSDGWSINAPKVERMLNGKRSARVPLDRVDRFKDLGWDFGRPTIHTAESKERIGHASRTRKERFPDRDWSTEYKRGSEHQLFGKTQSIDVCRKISI